MYRNIRCIIKKLILISLAFISLVLGASVAIGSQAEPAQADTTIPMYGCPSTLNGSPIGGGTGYTEIYSASTANTVVPVGTTDAQFRSILSGAASGNVIYVADGCVIQMASATPFNVKAGVTLASGRGASSNPGKILLPQTTSDTSWNDAITLNSGARASGLTIVGASTSSTNSYHRGGIGAYANAEIDNCEIYGMGGGQAIITYASGVWVHHNYLHHNQCTSQSGYGIEVYQSYGDPCIVEGCMFDYNKHHIASVADLENWIFRYNYLGANCIGGQIDQHGNNDGGDVWGGSFAGNHIEIYNNTSINTGDWFVQIRGIPNDFTSVHHNWTYLKETWTAQDSDWGPPGGPIAQFMGNLTQGYTAPNSGPYVKMESYNNWYGTTPPPSTNVAPVLNAIGNKSIKEGATLSFSISASDANGDALTYSASNLPTGATFNTATRTFSWAPTLSQAGVYTGVHFEVSDGQMSDYEDIAITVIDEVAPVLAAIGNKGVNEGATLSFSVSASDANGDALTYSASNLPAGATFNSASRTFSWTPGYGQSGTYANVHFQGSDGTLTDSEDIVITVTASSSLQGDVNGDGAVNSLDMIRVGQHWNETGDDGWIPEDINRDGMVNVLDATLVGQGWTG